MALMIALTVLGWAIVSLTPASAQSTSVDLAISGEIPSSVTPGSTFALTLWVDNVGSSGSAGATVSTYIDPSLRFISGLSSSGSCAHDDSLVVCSVGALAPGDRTEIDITASPTEEGIVFAGADARARESDPNSGNDVWVGHTTIGAVIAQPPSSISLTPTDDSYVKSTSPSSNYGGNSALEVDGEPVQVILMRFDLRPYAGLDLRSASLTLHNVDPSPNGGAVTVSDGAPWSESTVTWANKPGWSSASSVPLGAVSTGSDYEVDVSSLVAAGRDVTLVITSENRNGADYSSTEGSHPPRLELNFAEGPPSPPEPEPEPSYVPVTTVLTAAADTWVDASAPAANHGTASSLETDGSPVKRIYMSFDLAGITGDITAARLRLYNVDPSPAGGTVYLTSGDWAEGTLTYETVPATGLEVGSLSSVSAGQWYEIDLSSVAVDGGRVSLVIESTSTNGADYSSREGTKPPQLIVEHLEPGS